MLSCLWLNCGLRLQLVGCGLGLVIRQKLSELDNLLILFPLDVGSVVLSWSGLVHGVHKLGEALVPHRIQIRLLLLISLFYLLLLLF